MSPTVLNGPSGARPRRTAVKSAPGTPPWLRRGAAAAADGAAKKSVAEDVRGEEVTLCFGGSSPSLGSPDAGAAGAGDGSLEGGAFWKAASPRLVARASPSAADATSPPDGEAAAPHAAAGAAPAAGDGRGSGGSSASRDPRAAAANAEAFPFASACLIEPSPSPPLEAQDSSPAAKIPGGGSRGASALPAAVGADDAGAGTGMDSPVAVTSDDGGSATGSGGAGMGDAKDALNRLLQSKKKELLRLQLLAKEKQLEKLRGRFQGQRIGLPAAGAAAAWPRVEAHSQGVGGPSAPPPVSEVPLLSTADAPGFGFGLRGLVISEEKIKETRRRLDAALARRRGMSGEPLILQATPGAAASSSSAGPAAESSEKKRRSSGAAPAPTPAAAGVDEVGTRPRRHASVAAAAALGAGRGGAAAEDVEGGGTAATGSRATLSENGRPRRHSRVSLNPAPGVVVASDAPSAKEARPGSIAAAAAAWAAGLLPSLRKASVARLSSKRRRASVDDDEEDDEDIAPPKGSRRAALVSSSSAGAAVLRGRGLAGAAEEDEEAILIDDEDDDDDEEEEEEEKEEDGSSGSPTPAHAGAAEGSSRPKATLRRAPPTLTPRAARWSGMREGAAVGDEPPRWAARSRSRSVGGASDESEAPRRWRAEEALWRSGRRSERPGVAGGDAFGNSAGRRRW